MKKKIILKNSLYSVINYLLLLLLSFWVRKVLIANFPIEYAGYEALFTDVFTLLSIADLGLDSIISYRIYEKIIYDQDAIWPLMKLAKKMYFLISMVVLVIGFAFLLLIPYLFSAQVYDLKLITAIYIIQVSNLIISYLMGYKRLLLIADQKEYICLRWDSLVMICVQISRILVLVYTKNYLVYVSLCIIQTAVQNLGIMFAYKKEYGNVENKKCVVAKFSEIKSDMGNFLCHKISSVVYSSTDNIVITALLGLISAGYYSNYYMISKYTYSLASKLMKPMQASIGNFLYSNSDKKKKVDTLSELNTWAYIYASFICNSLVYLSTPFIKIWLGEQYIQTEKLPLLLAVNIFIAINQDFIYYFRNAYGKYEYDKKYMILSAVVNLVVSIVLGTKWGLIGIVLGTIIGHLFIWYGRVKFVFTECFDISQVSYWQRQVLQCVSLFLQIVLLNFFIDAEWSGIKGLIYRELLVIGVSIINAIVFGRKYLYKYLKKVSC